MRVRRKRIFGLQPSLRNSQLLLRLLPIIGGRCQWGTIRSTISLGQRVQFGRISNESIRQLENRCRPVSNPNCQFLYHAKFSPALESVAQNVFGRSGFHRTCASRLPATASLENERAPLPVLRFIFRSTVEKHSEQTFENFFRQADSFHY